MAAFKQFLTAFGLAGLTLLACAPMARAQSDAAPDVAKPEAALNPPEKLDVEQQRIAEKYKHLEEVLLRMAELNAATDPRRAALLKKAVKQSKERLINVRFERLVELLGKDQLSRALENQADLGKDLSAILELLLSENRAKRIENEKARIREYLKRLSKIIRQEKDIQGRTAGDDDPKHLAGEQKKIAEKTGGLAKDIQENEEQAKGDDKSGKGESGKGESGKGESGKG